MTMKEAVGPFKVFTPCGGCYPGIDSPEGAVKKADEIPGSRIVDSDGVVLYTSEVKPPTV
jgi:hypothetical protein